MYIHEAMTIATTAVRRTIWGRGVHIRWTGGWTVHDKKGGAHEYELTPADLMADNWETFDDRS